MLDSNVWILMIVPRLLMIIGDARSGRVRRRGGVVDWMAGLCNASRDGNSSATVRDNLKCSSLLSVLT